MPDKQVFDYAIIRLVPQVEREEFINIGVILFSKRKKYLDVKFHINSDRICAFSNLVDIEDVKKHIQSWTLICAGGSEAGPIGELDQTTRFKWLTATRSTIIQASKIHPGLSSDPASMLDRLFEQYVE